MHDVPYLPLSIQALFVNLPARGSHVSDKIRFSLALSLFPSSPSPNMKTSSILVACASGLAVQAFSVSRIAQNAAQQVQGFMSPEQYLIELSPGKTKWVTDAEKWALRRV
jgi:hypothetical protein